MSAQITVVGIGADGWEGLAEPARRAILAAGEIHGSARQLESLPPGAPPRHVWPSPLLPAVESLVARESGEICVLASGDPMLHGIGATFAARLPHDRLRVIPHVSAFALACARLRWPQTEVSLLSAVTQPVDVLARVLCPGRRAVVYGSGADHASRVARVLTQRGFGASRMVALERLGAADERVTEAPAWEWGLQALDPLHVVAVECAGTSELTPLPLVPGLPDDAFEHDGALTKRHVRAATLAMLAPMPGRLLWDVGAGSGSIAIEWLRAEPTARAVAIEARAERAERIGRNAAALGVPALRVVVGSAPAALAQLEPPDAVFIGGGLTSGVLAQVWTALRPGGRLVANAVTIQGEQLLIGAASEHGGELVKLAVSHAEPLGSFSAWRPALPVVQWAAVKP